MSSDRRTAIVVGILFIIATAAPIASFPFLKHLQESDLLAGVFTYRSDLITGAFLELTMALAISGIALAIYPVLRRYWDTLALGYVAARSIESVIFLVVAVFSISSLITLGHEYAEAPSPDAAYYQTLANLLVNAHDWSYVVSGKIIFSISALILNSVLYQFKIVPRFLSAWALVGALLLLAGGVLQMLGLVVGDSVVITAAFLPIAVQEMFFAVWLIAKGFNPTTAAEQ